MAHEGLGETSGRCVGVFYADDGMVVSQDPYWLQHLMNVLVGLFRKYGLAANVANSCTMTFQPGLLRSGMSEEVKALKCTGVRDSYRVRLRRSIPCPECGFEITAGSMTAHRRRMHGTELEIDWSQLPVSQTEHQPQVYNLRFLQSTKRCPCPFPGFPGFYHMWNGLRLKFISQHRGGRLKIL